MAEIKDKVVTVESLSALHEYNKETYRWAIELKANELNVKANMFDGRLYLYGMIEDEIAFAFEMFNRDEGVERIFEAAGYVNDVSAAVGYVRSYKEYDFKSSLKMPEANTEYVFKVNESQEAFNLKAGRGFGESFFEGVILQTKGRNTLEELHAGLYGMNNAYTADYRPGLLKLRWPVWSDLIEEQLSITDLTPIGGADNITEIMWQQRRINSMGNAMPDVERMLIETDIDGNAYLMTLLMDEEEIIKATVETVAENRCFGRVYLKEKPSKKQPRMDVIEILIDKETHKVLNLNHIRNAYGV